MEDYESLYAHLKNDQTNLNRLVNVKQNLASETVNFEALHELIIKHLPLCLKIYENFENILQKTDQTPHDIDLLLKSVNETLDRDVLRTMDVFNQSIVKTNFYNPQKSATAFRLNPQIFLKDMRLPEIPYGLYLIIGRDFTGFHIRFRDISRGGVRIILSNQENFQQNRQIQFNENYGLAYTQKKKNKDIPESGSKGTILMHPGKNHMRVHAFMQYVDAMSDIMLEVPGSVDLDGKKEIIFLGPDENSADLMEPAALFMKKKNYPLWKSFTTGKPPSLGGVPHDTYGMTTRSVRCYVKGIQRKLQLEQKNCTKFMTGGPDGDLGSNEILMGEEKVVGVVDGSGVLFDPEGIHRESLVQLAKSRRMIKHYTGPLSSKGYQVLVTDENRQLPTGQFVESGLHFRNEFHLNQDVVCDFFVPCGGRPESINLQNLDRMFTKQGAPRFKYIVEGANLFISEGARQKLEDAGVILFKDASTNKGGVTSSSYEVQAALCMKDDQFMELMTVQNGEIPQFYQNYVKDICASVEEKATMEFEYIWNAHQITNKRNIEITDKLSGDMNDLYDLISNTDFFEDQALRRSILKDVIPKSLQDLLGMDTLLERIPINYQKAMFCKHIGAKYYYSCGAESNIYEFYNFMKNYNTSQ